MSGFNFEKNLAHQTRAVESTIAVFENIDIIKPASVDKNSINPQFDFLNNNYYADNIVKLQQRNGIEVNAKQGINIIDIMMETGTGKTYTYTKTIFELNKNFGIFKFVIIIPTLSIKAGTIDFLKQKSAREHFKEQYGKTINLHIVESKKSGKNKKTMIPPAVSSFVESGNFEKTHIQVMIINAGMINSKTMQQSFDASLFDKYSIPFEAVAAVKPFLIIDEPHKFDNSNKTWQNLKKLQAQFILRYGATFPEQNYQNLIYTLTAVDSFNRNLVKGVIGHITEFEDGKNAIVKFVNSNGIEASFELIANKKQTKKLVRLIRKDSLQKIHPAMTNLTIENLNKTKVVLSNGLEMKKGDKINPYSYAQTLQEVMLQKTIKNHFKIERELLTREVKIKPITLFFIDNISEYRNANGYIRTTIENLITAEVKLLLKTEKDQFYKAYLEKTIIAISKTHGGYFSKDNSEKDEAIETEITEILHDKQAMLSLDNPRRFIFSKWTLREGWDNPNVFQICKLRSSGSEISKLQEVGRGLRLPVNQYGNRVKDEQFYLHYFVDFTENDFVDKLVTEINEKSGAISMEDTPESISDPIIKNICDLYKTTEDDLFELLRKNNVITQTNKFKADGFNYIKENYPLIFESVASSKIKKSTAITKKTTIITKKYEDLKVLWEKINEKVILEYKFKDESHFKDILIKFFEERKSIFAHEAGITIDKKSKVNIENDKAYPTEEISVLDNKITLVSTMKYSEFLMELSKILNINIKTLHHAFIDSKIPINKYLNMTTIRIIKQNFNEFLMCNAIGNFGIEYQKVSNSIHPTKLTDSEGKNLAEIPASDVGIFSSDDKVANEYLFKELFYDSELEKKNIKEHITEVVVFTKIPKNSIKIPVAGGKSYSPDFAYVLKFKDGKKKLHFIVETKNVDSNDSLRNEEIQKIAHAKIFFKDIIDVKFKTQFSNDKIAELIKDCI